MKKLVINFKLSTEILDYITTYQILVLPQRIEAYNLLTNIYWLF